MIPPPRPSIHGALIGTGHYNDLVKVCDARWWQVWRWFDLLVWSIKAKARPTKLLIPFVDNGEAVVLYVVKAGTLPGVPSANAYHEH